MTKKGSQNVITQQQRRKKHFSLLRDWIQEVYQKFTEILFNTLKNCYI